MKTSHWVEFYIKIVGNIISIINCWQPKFYNPKECNIELGKLNVDVILITGSFQVVTNNFMVYFNEYLWVE